MNSIGEHDAGHLKRAGNSDCGMSARVGLVDNGDQTIKNREAPVSAPQLA
jgi:hypothetical protein